MKITDLKKRLRKDRPARTVTLRLPEDLIDDLERIAAARGHSGYQALLQAYVGQGLRRDLEAVERPDSPVGQLGHEELAQLDALDYRLLQGLAGLASGSEIGGNDLQDLLRRYLDEEISLAHLAGRLGISRFELTESLRRLGVPLRIGPADLDEARAEVRSAQGQGETSKDGESSSGLPGG